MKGMQSISKGMASELYPGSLFPDSAVSQIRQEDSSCLVVTDKGHRFRAKKDVISVPMPLYKMIDFSHSLPKAKTALAASATLGYYSKTILIYNKPLWRDVGLRSSFISFSGAVSFSYDTAVEANG